MTTTSSRLPSASLGPDQAESTSRFLQRLAWARPAIQLGVLAVVLAPLWWPWVGRGPSFYQGNFAGGRLQIGSWWIPLSDPFTALSVAASSRTFPFALVLGALLALGFYLLVRARTFCSFACPIHLVLEVWDRLLVRWKIRNEKIGEEWPWWTNASMAALLIVASGMVGMPIYEPINPIDTLVRSVQHVALGGLGLVAAVMVFEACAGRRVFCRHLCPVGGFYGMVNRLGFAGVAVDPQTCTGCRRCVAHCLAAPELDTAIVAAQQREIQAPRAVESMHCTFCLDCAARCDHGSILFHNRWRGGRSSPMEDEIRGSQCLRGSARFWTAVTQRSAVTALAETSSAPVPAQSRGPAKAATPRCSVAAVQDADAIEDAPFGLWAQGDLVVRGILCLAALALPLLAGCGDRQARREDGRILMEFRGPNFVAVADRRPVPGGPPLVPHVVYRENFNCLVCHAHQEFVFRGQLVPSCPHPERKACLQCHVSLQSDEQPFRFEMLGQGQMAAAATAKEKQP